MVEHIEFKTYEELVIIEKMLLSSKYMVYRDGDKYYDSYTEDEIMSYISPISYLVFSVDKNTSIYSIVHMMSLEKNIFSYPNGYTSFKNRLLIPTYKGRTILKQ